MYKLAAIILSFTSVSAFGQQPEIKEGLPNFIKNNIIYPSYSKYNCIQGLVNVGFKLNAKGEVYYSVITSGLGIDLDKEALRLVRMSSLKWSVPDTHDTTSLLIVPVNFTLTGYDCDRKSKAEIALAIKAYKDDEELTNVISNYYKNKERGTSELADEIKVIQIKNQLGIDDEYLDERINAGLKKIKQGDRQGACEEFNFVKYMGSDKAKDLLDKYCK
ncbi:energy transducer TonB [Pedobacter cryotolerans]|uniref:Energy transducer TonB n=1 Tax=Pedobacter cryotolerans TaxID=2571270 RepID=A0A4U1C8Y8_9SPHI|nr:energy transducer TonB [Pedobacter cryotolerans]TKC02051.1 energy transducer TonB [Pedobacter cryotolerans]